MPNFQGELQLEIKKLFKKIAVLATNFNRIQIASLNSSKKEWNSQAVTSRSKGLEATTLSTQLSDTLWVRLPLPTNILKIKLRADGLTLRVVISVQFYK